MLFEIVSAKMSSIVETVVLENFTGKAFIFYGVISTFFYQLELFGMVNRMIFFEIRQKSTILDRGNPMSFLQNSKKWTIFDRINPMNFLQNFPKISYFG